MFEAHHYVTGLSASRDTDNTCAKTHATRHTKMLQLHHFITRHIFVYKTKQNKVAKSHGHIIRIYVRVDGLRMGPKSNDC